MVKLKIMKVRFLAVFFLMTCFSLSLMAKRVDFNRDWKFNLGDALEATQSKFDDSDWEMLNLPHDWSFERGYSQHNAQRENGGYLMGGIGWYRKNFEFTDRDLLKKEIFIDFEGVYRNSEVWINGEYLGKRPYGYISFSYDLTPYLKTGENTIAVRVDNSLEPSARWYHGCGIYGNVHIRIKDQIFIEKDGVFVQTPSMENVNITAEVISQNNSTVDINYVVYDPSGRKVAKARQKKVALKSGKTTLDFTINVNNAMLWSPDTPNMYTLEMDIKGAKGERDSQSVRFGFRTIEWSTESGFHLNGKQLKLRGVCEHMEGGPTGALSPDAVVRWRLQQIKDMGCNAVRVAHNPYLPSFYDICDEIGLLVMDEIFDGWQKKAEYDYGQQAFEEWWDRDLEAWIRRNRNHPSIFLYSVGNETEGDIATELVARCHKYDPTRLVTSGDSNPDDMDVYGVNGRSEMIEGFINKWDKRKPFVATENPHTWQVRGYYRTQTWYRDGYPNIKQNTQFVPNLTEEEIFTYDWTAPKGRRSRKQIFNSSYDNAFVRVTARHLIEIIRQREWFSGSFRWTGYDYLGEAGYVHGGWPFRVFQSGAMDIAGFKKDLFYLYQSEWSNKDMVHILPHWTHPVMTEGTLIPVWAYTTGDEVELFLNGESLGRRRKGPKWNEIQCEWLVPWEKGTIEAVAYRNGVEISRTSHTTSASPSNLSIYKYEDREMKCDGEDVAIVTIEQQDDKGVFYPYGENRIYAKIYGDAKMLSFESGSPVDVECNYNAGSKKAFMGLNRMFIQSTKKSKDPISVVVASISGDKKLMLSNKISITANQLVLAGKAKKLDFEIRYTTNGETPSLESKLYIQPFEIELGTTIRALVYVNGEPIIEMEERFTKDDGLYWGKVGEEICEFDGLQAEWLSLYKAKQSKWNGDGYYADGFVEFNGAGSSLSLYQENDGDAYEAKITLRYSQEHENVATTEMEMYNNNEIVGVIEFTNTGSQTTHWMDKSAKIKINKGANNIKFVCKSDKTPAIDQITIK